MRAVLYAMPLAVFLLIGVWIAVPLIRGDDPRQLPSALIDQPAPDFELPPLPGYENGLSTADLVGQVDLVNVFASWCVPCLAEHPIITRLAEEAGVRVLGINYQDAPDDALDWLERHGNPYERIGADRDGRIAIDWGVYGVPETFIVDRDGRIRYRHPGPITPDILTQEILPLLTSLESP